MKRLIDLAKKRPALTGVVGAAAAALGIWLFFGFFGFHTLFFDEEVSEANPFAAGAGASGLPGDETSQQLADAMNDAMDEQGITGDSEIDEAVPESPDVVTLVQGEFIDRSHPTSGIAKVITDGDRRFLRFENFETDNGPDLDVYLATGPPDGDLGEYINLAELKGNIGDQNYELTDDIDLDRYTTVFIWCTRFSVAFGAAALA